MSGNRCQNLDLFLFFLLAVKNDESTYLLARTYYLSGDVNKSYWLLRNSSIEHLPAAKLLLAKCCFDIDKYVRRAKRQYRFLFFDCSDFMKPKQFYSERILQSIHSPWMILHIRMLTKPLLLYSY